MQPKNRAALVGSVLGAIVQVGDRVLVTRAMRAHTSSNQNAMSAIGATSPFYVRPALGSLIAVATTRRIQAHQRTAPVVGAGLVVGGFVLRAWSLRTLGRFYSPVVEVRPDHRVVENGPYRYVRHPGYLAGLTQAIGVGVGFGTVVGTAGIAGSWLSVFIPRINEEEAVLLDALGADYARFCRNRQRLVPFIW